MFDCIPMNTNDLNYKLPPEQIAQYPARNRAEARLLVVSREQDELKHCLFSALPELLQPGDLLVLNDTRVIPARVFGKRIDTGGKVEILFVEQLENQEWEAIIKARARPAPGWRIILGSSGNLVVVIKTCLPNGRFSLLLETQQPLLELLDSIGLPPLPPYIKRQIEPFRNMDLQRYQTVYASVPGAIAAPTAGLHFTHELLQCLHKKNIDTTTLTLHVGPGTFKPIQSSTLAEHVMESERFIINPETAACISATRRRGGRIVAVGTTAVRSLETAATKDGSLAACEGRSSIFLFPPYRFKIVDGMVTNFHLPRSTPLAMVCAMAGREKIMRAYQCAIKEGYRFYSYGDAMLII